MRRERHSQFETAPFRVPAHSGTGYPEEMTELRTTLDDYLQNGPPPASDPIIGLAAPHVSPWGGWQSYAAAYGRLSGAARQHAASFGYRCPVLLDPRHKLVAATGVTITPEVAVVTADGPGLHATELAVA